VTDDHTVDLSTDQLAQASNRELAVLTPATRHRLTASTMNLRQSRYRYAIWIGIVVGAAVAVALQQDSSWASSIFITIISLIACVYLAADITDIITDFKESRQAKHRDG